MISGEWGYLENGTYYNIPGPSEGDQLDGGIGTDLILGSRAGDTILGGEGNDFLSGLDGDDVVRGDAGNDAVTGGSHNDILSGGAGDDILFGDGYLVFSGATVADLPAFGVQYTFAANGYPSGYTTTRFSIATDAEVGGDDILTGGAGRDWLDGGLGADMLDGGSESDSLFGGADNDSLFGGAGNDWLAGGTGNDIMVGGLGDDTYIVDSVDDIVIELTSEGVDSIQSSVAFALPENVEHLILTGNGNMNATGNASDNLLSGTKGANISKGNDGNDTLIDIDGDDILDGGKGLDWMGGGLDNDTYIVDNAGDIVVENANEGIDLVQSTINYSLGAHIENLVLSGNDALNGTGNALANMITGNSAVNILDGGAGSDILRATDDYHWTWRLAA